MKLKANCSQDQGPHNLALILTQACLPVELHLKHIVKILHVQMDADDI